MLECDAPPASQPAWPETLCGAAVSAGPVAASQLAIVVSEDGWLDCGVQPPSFLNRRTSKKIDQCDDREDQEELGHGLHSELPQQQGPHHPMTRARSELA